MTKEELLKIFPTATPEQIANMLNSIDTEVAIAGKSKISDADLQTLRDKAKKFDDAEAEKLSAEEKLKQALADAEKSKNDNLMILNRTKAVAELAKAGISESDYKDIIDGIVTADEEKTVSLAKNMAALITKTKSDTEANLKDNRLKNMEKPDGGADIGSGNEKSDAEKFAESIAKNRAESLKTAQESRKFYTGG